MAYEYSIQKLVKKPSLNGQTDVVVQATLQCRNTETGKVSSCPVGFSVDDIADNENYTAFADLTETQVVSWITDNSDFEAFIAMLKEETQVPVTISEETEALPWE